MFAALTARLRGAYAECCTTPLRIKKFFHRLHPAGNEKARQHSNAKRAHAPFSETCWRPGTPRLQAGSKSAPRNGKTNRLREQAMPRRSEEHTSELQSLMRISYAVFCLKKKKTIKTNQNNTHKRRNTP